MSRALCMLVGLWVSSDALAARRSRLEETVSEPAPWETPNGKTETRLELARALLDAGAPDAALEMIAGLRAEGIKGVEVDRLHAKALRAVGLDDDARVILEGIAKKSPRDAVTRNELGILAMDRGEIVEAIDQFAAAVHSEPQNADYLNNLGFAQLSANRASEAVETLRAALRADSANLRTRNNLGFALVSAGLVDEAWRVFKASSRGPADAHYNIGVGLERQGATADALARYQKALEADPTHIPARDALTRLAGSTPAFPASQPEPK